MSSGKKKISQVELRRLMCEHKKKLPQKIVSSVAKYTIDGQLTCNICNTTVVSDRVWESHLNSKQHQDNRNRLKRDLEPPPMIEHEWKRPAEVDSTMIRHPKKPKGILKSSSPGSDDGIPDKFARPVLTGLTCTICNVQIPAAQWSAHLTSKQHMANKRQLNVKSPPPAPVYVQPQPKCLSEKLRGLHNSITLNVPHDMFDSSNTSSNPMGFPSDVEEDGNEKKTATPDENIPEGFFDDPMLDAKARNIEYKDPVEEEWEKFQKVIKEESSVSAQIISEDQDEATVDRQIDEIDEQMRNWSRVLDLERRKEQLEEENAGKERTEDDGPSSPEETEFEEFLDWRVKKAFK